MPAPKLSVGDFGEEVAQLHQNLTQSGFSVSPEEVKRKFFGPSTRAAVSELQSANNMEATGHADELIHAVLANAPSLSNTGAIDAPVTTRIPSDRVPPVFVPLSPPL